MSTLPHSRNSAAFFKWTACWAFLGLLGVAFEVGAQPGSDPADYKKAAAEKPTSATPEGYVPKTRPTLPLLDDKDGRGKRVVVIPIKGTIDLGLSPFVERALHDATGAAAIILDVDTFGGRVDAAVKIRDHLLATQIPTIAFVNRRAISAGALISLAADHIVFTSGGSMGAATPIQLEGGKATAVGEKMVSYMRSEMRATAEANGRDGDLAEAMVDADIEIPGVSKPGKLLTVTTDLAMEIGLASAQIETMSELFNALGLNSATVINPAPNWAERIARFLTDPVVSGLLMSLGMLGLLVEFYSPGFGLAGGVGILFLVAFFAGHMVVDLAGWEEILLFTVGVVLLGVEVFVIPGFGVIGMLGILLLAASLVMAMLGMPMGKSWELGQVAPVLTIVLLALSGTMIGMVLLVKFLPNQRFAGWLILETTLASTAEDTIGQTNQTLIGKRGIANGDLRPAGKAHIDGRLIDVVSQVDYIESGAPIRVLDIEGFRVVVVRDDALEITPKTIAPSEESA